MSLALFFSHVQFYVRTYLVCRSTFDKRISLHGVFFTHDIILTQSMCSYLSYVTAVHAYTHYIRNANPSMQLLMFV